MQRPDHPLLDALDEVVADLTRQEALVKEIKERVHHAARELHKIDNNATRLSAAAFAYWFIPQIKVEDLAFAAFGRTPRAGILLRQLAGSMASEIRCKKCDSKFVVKTRSELVELIYMQKRRWRSHQLICDQCYSRDLEQPDEIEVVRQETG